MGRRQDADNKSLIGIVYLCKRVQSGRTLNFADCLTDVGSALESIRKVRDVGGGWLGRRDSNPDTQLQRLQSYR